MKTEIKYYCEHCGEEIIGFVVKNSMIAYDQTENGLVETNIKEESYICNNCYQIQEKLNDNLDELNKNFIELHKRSANNPHQELNN